MSDIVDSSLKTAVKGTTLLLLGTIVSNALWFVTKLIIVRSTTTEQLGIYSLAFAVGSILSNLASLGLVDGTTRYISIFLGEDKKEEAISISRSSLQIGLISGTAVFVLLFLLSDIIGWYVFSKPEVVIPLRIVSFMVPFYALSVILVGILRGYSMIKPKVFFFEIGMPFFLLFFLTIILFFKLPFTMIIAAYTASTVAVYMAIGIFAYRKLGLLPFSVKGYGYRRTLLTFSISVQIMSLMILVFSWTDTLMLGRYAGAEKVGMYNVSVVVANILLFPYYAFGFILMPLAGEMHARGQSYEIKRTYQVLTKWIFSFTLPLFFILFFFPEMTITFLFGERFVVSAAALRLLSLGFLTQACLGASVFLMMVMGLSHEIWKTALFGAFLNIVLNYTLIKHLHLGIVGAALATAASYLVISTVNFFFLFVRTRIHPFTIGYIKPLAGSAVIGLVLYGSAKSLPLHLWMLPVYLMLFMGGYFILLLLTRSIDREDMMLFDAITEKTGMEMKFLKALMKRFLAVN